MERKRLRFALKIKAVDESSGTFVGMGAVYSNTDLGGDRLMPGSMTRTLSAGKMYPLLWQHDPSNPIGTAKVTDTPQGLQVEGTLLLQDPTALKAYTFMKAGVIKGMSIGYETIQSSMEGDVRLLKEVRLWEISVVTFPMNESATIQSVKSLSLSDDEVQHHLQALRRHQKGMRYHIKCLLGDDLDDDGADDPALLEDDDSEQDVESKALLLELQKLVAAAGGLASA
jgi:HK97 family phage prohead protease